MIQEGYSPSSTGNNRSFPLPTELRTSTGLSGTLPTRFPLHKGVPSLLYSPLVTSPYQCQFISSRYQVIVLCFSIMDLGLLYSRVTIIFWTRFLFSSRTTFQFLLFLIFVQVNTSIHCTILFVSMYSLSLSQPSAFLRLFSLGRLYSCLLICCCELFSSHSSYSSSSYVCMYFLFPYFFVHIYVIFSTFGLFFHPILEIPMASVRRDL
jgi:hypothetical protein